MNTGNTESPGHNPPRRTASDGVRDTYYGKPVIKAPQWRWLIITYFYLGGMTGASFTIGTIANLFSRDPRIERTARYLSLAALLPCPPLLILDLGRPERFVNMLRVVKLRSPMSLGSWTLAFMGLFVPLAAGLQALADVKGADTFAGLRRVVGILGLPFSIFLSGYTGILLAATNVPIWWRAFPLLSPTFVSSAYSTSLSAIALLLGFGRHERGATAEKLAQAEIVCLGTELVALSAVVVRTGKIGRPLTAGRLGAIFWPITYVGGLLVPLLLHLRARNQTARSTLARHAFPGPLRSPSEGPTRIRTIAAVLAMVGGYSLRALIVFAGHESARRPEDYFAMTTRKRP